MKRILLLSALFFLFAVQAVWGQIPQTISYQGVLADSSGNAVFDGSYTLIFRFYDSATDGNLLWSETQTVTISDGIFNVILGSMTSLTLAFDKQYWLAIKVEGGSELTPRIPLTSVPYSLNPGPQGPQGEQGPVGPQGEQGPAGPQGPKGDKGVQGDAGPQGLQGDPGLQGPQGDQGPKGDKGDQGDAGPQGLQGDPGLQGAQGDPGPQGETGPEGPAGPQGETGPEGPAGPQGSQGDPGPQGPQGDQGDTGAQGPAGSANISGSANYLIKFTGTTTGGNSQLYDNGLNVGIGTSNPMSRLHLAGGAIRIDHGSGFSLMTTLSQDLTIVNRASGNIIFGTGTPSFGATRMVIANNGLVGIGTPTPQAGLHVSGDGGNGTVLVERSGKTLALNPNYGGNNQFAHISTIVGSNMGLKLDVNEQNRITMTTGGNVGIGTTGPGEKLDVRSGTSPGAPFAAAGQWTIFGSGGTGQHGILGQTAGSGRWGGVFYNSNSNSEVDIAGPHGMIVKSGNVGIGTTNPLGNFQTRVGNNQNFAVLQHDGLLTLESMNDAFNNLGDMKFRADFFFLDGYAGIGTPGSLNFRLHVNGSAGKPGGGSWSNASDARLKDIREHFTRGLEAIDRLIPVYYKYKKDNPINLPSDKQHVGLIAQEVQKVIPEAVGKYQDDYLSVDNDPIIWTMLNAIKQLKAENSATNAELEIMKSKMAQLEASLQKLVEFTTAIESSNGNRQASQRVSVNVQ